MFIRSYDFRKPLDDLWEAIPGKGWSFRMAPGRARLVNTTAGNAEVYLRPCSICGDRFELAFAPGGRRVGILAFGFLAGFEFITARLNLDRGELEFQTHEFHKEQPRLRARLPRTFQRLVLVREKDSLPGLPYGGSRVRLLCDSRVVAEVRHIDFLPESLLMFGLHGPGEITLASVAIRGLTRPQPEYVRVGLWQQSAKTSVAANVNGLLKGVRKAAEAGVEILATPETSLTGLRPAHPELSDRALIQAELKRFQRGVRGIRGAPCALVGYPEWIPGSTVEGSTLARVKVNAHRFVMPDGSLGPRMAKVHSCEEGLWHGRTYNLQRVNGVLVALGVCHDVRYPDVWATGVMGGARLCFHAVGAGGPSGRIPAILDTYRGLGTNLDAFWVRVNAGGGSAIVYPQKNRKHPDTILAVPKDLAKASPTYPFYAFMDEQLAHARLRLWDAAGCYPMRTLRSGRERYRIWSSLIPKVAGWLGRRGPEKKETTDEHG